MTEHRERRVNQTVDFLNAWAGIGAFARILFVFFAIAACIWAFKAIAETVLWVRVLLG